MTGILQNYILTFLHPFKTHTVLRVQRELRLSGGQLRLASEEDVQVDTEKTGVGLNFFEGLSVSWFFYTLHGIYSLVAVHLGLQTYQLFEQNETFLNTMFLEEAYFEQRLFIVRMILWTVLFPLSSWLFVKFWGMLIRFFVSLYNLPKNYDEAVEEITSNALASHTLLIIPIFGPLAQHVSSLVMLFAGLRNNLQMSVSQSLLIIFAPIILMLLVLFLSFLSFAMLFIG